MLAQMRPDLSFLTDSIHLVAIHPETRAIAAKWFGVDRAVAETWAHAQNETGANVYWTVNHVRAGLDRKPTKADIVGVRFAHVDVDPPSNGRPWDPGAVLASCGWLRPTVVVNSGNGIQGLWGVSGAPTQAEIEAVNRGIAHKLGGDACWNVDRLLRVPGTVNYPDAKKRAQGRTEKLATLERAENIALRYAPSALALAFPPPPPSKSTAEEAEIGPFDPIPWQELGKPPSDLLRARITAEQVLGGRSEQVAGVAKMMLYEGYTREEVAGVLYCPDNSISAHIFDQPDPERAARRMATRAHAPTPATDDFGDAPTPAVGPTAVRARGQLLSLGELMAQPRPPELIRGVLPAAGVGFLGGQSGALKTFLAIELAVCLATGKVFAGHMVTRTGAVVLAAFEGEATFADRFRAHSEWQPEQLPIRVLSAFGPVASDADFLDFGNALLIAAADLPLAMSAVIIDTVAAAGMIGEDKENDPAAWQRVFDKLRPIARALGCPIILVHHYGKAAEAGLRGSSNARAGADFVLAMTCERDEQTGDNTNHRLAVTKNRSGREGLIANVTKTEVPVGTWDDGSSVTALRLRFEPPTAAPKPKSVAAEVLEEAFKEVRAGRDAVPEGEVRVAFDRLYAQRGSSKADTLRKQFTNALKDVACDIYADGLHLRSRRNGRNSPE